MRTIGAYVFVLLAVALCGCNPKCIVGCGGNLFLATVGFSRSQTDSSILIVRSPDGSQYTQCTGAVCWNFPTPADTLSDTFINHIFAFTNGVDGTGVDVIFPVAGDTFRIRDIELGGDVAEKQACREGSPSPGFCKSSPYLKSYTVNGRQVNLPAVSNPGDTTGYIYLIKP